VKFLSPRPNSQAQAQARYSTLLRGDVDALTLLSCSFKMRWMFMMVIVTLYAKGTLCKKCELQLNAPFMIFLMSTRYD